MLLNFLSENMFIPAGKIRPTDKFDKEFARIKTLEVVDSDIDYFSGLTFNKFFEAAKDKKIDLEKVLEQIKTVDEYIRKMASIVQEGTKSNE